jgi:GAF domain
MNTRFTETVTAEACKMIDSGKCHKEILAHLIYAAEKVAGGNSVSSILVLDEQGLLRNGASPRLPNDYLSAIDGIKPAPDVGTCASTAATGCMTITRDFMDDSKWTELRHLPLALGFVGAWSMPIKTIDGKVLGTFGTYFREKRDPREDEIRAISSFSEVAAKVLGSRN